MFFNYKYGFDSGIKAGFIFSIGWPILSGLSIYLADFLNDLTSSIRPLIVSLGNIFSSSEPLREMRAELQEKIRNLVEELGPLLYDNFEDIRVVRKEDIAAEKRTRQNHVDSAF